MTDESFLAGIAILADCFGFRPKERQLDTWRRFFLDVSDERWMKAIHSICRGEERLGNLVATVQRHLGETRRADEFRLTPQEEEFREWYAKRYAEGKGILTQEQWEKFAEKRR